MHKNYIWLALIATIVCIALYFSGVTLYKIYRYTTLTATTSTHEVEWSVKKLAEDRYALKAKYSYDINDKTQRGESLLTRIIYRNGWAAKQALKEKENQKVVVWYSPQKISYSTLQKSFPIKESVYCGILWVLFIYFIWLGFYVGRKKI